MIVSCDIDGLSRTEPFPAPFVTMSFDLETSITKNTILCAAAVIDRAGKRTEYPITGEVAEILQKLTEVVRLEDPDFITGYNIDNFDLPRMVGTSPKNILQSSHQILAVADTNRS